MRVVVTEKPSVARDLARVLGARKRGDGCFEGPDLRITWCFGHMAELVDPATYDPAWRTWSPHTLPMVPPQFQLQLRDGVADHWKHLRRLVRSADELVNACDAGREGELIFRYVLELAEAEKPALRFWASSLTDTAVRQAWARLQPGARYDALADAARCRSEADWLVGLNATRAMTCLARSNGGGQLLSVGRVQTPTLAMIVQRDREIEAFVPEDFWRVKARFAADAGAFDAVFFRSGEGADAARSRDSDDDDAPRPERLPTAEAAGQVEAAARDQVGTVTDAQRRRTTEKPPLLYDLTALQRRANQRYGLSAKNTLELAQALYERHKLLTYPRTDSRHLTPDQVPGLVSVVQAVGTLGPYAALAQGLLDHPIRPGRRVVDASEVGDHHAILPTDKAPRPGQLSADEKRIYDLVARRLLAALSPDAIFDVTDLVVAVPPRNGAPLPDGVTPPLRFRAKGRVCVDRGWQAADPPKKRAETELPPVSEGDRAPVASTDVMPGQTRPPRAHTDASLLYKMETAGRELDDAELKRAMKQSGLGTPATRAAILQTLEKRGYIDRRGKALIATDRGRALIDAVPVDDFKSAELTGRWEARLAAIADGREPRATFMRDVEARLRDTIAAILAAEPPPPEPGRLQESPSLGDCPLCGQPVRERKTVYSCDSGRGCPLVIGKKIAKRPIAKRTVTQLLTDGRTPALNRFISKKGRPFSAALVLEEGGRVGFSFPPRVSDPCPACETGKVMQGRTQLGCSRWREGCGWRG